MRRLGNWIVSVVFLAMITTPFVLLAVGFRPGAIENKDPAGFPLFDVGAILNQDLGAELDAYFEDALPGIDTAVEANAWIHEQLGESPNPEVIFGHDGWLFWRHTVNQPCLGAEKTAAFVDTLERADAVVTLTGRRFLLAVAPDKPSIYPEMMESEPDCVLETAASLGRLDLPGVLVTTWDDMEAAKGREPLYLALNTHWTVAGAAVHAAAIVDALDPGTWQPDALVATGTEEKQGDLTDMMGLPASETEIQYVSRPPGLTTTETVTRVETAAGEPVPGLEAHETATPGAPITGSTVVLHDSYGWSLLPVIAPYFEEAVFLRRVSPALSYLHPYLAAADTIIHTSVQRDLYVTAVEDDLAEQFVVAFEDELPSVPVTVTETDDTVEASIEAPEGTDPYLVVALDPGTDGATFTVGDGTRTLDTDRPVAAVFAPGGTLAIEVASGTVTYRGVAVPRS